MDNNIIAPQKTEKQDILSGDYNNWRKEIISLIEQSKLKAILSVNAELLTLYWRIGSDILTKQKSKVGVRKSLRNYQKTSLSVFLTTEVTLSVTYAI